MGWIFAETTSTPSPFQFEVRSEEIRTRELLPREKFEFRLSSVEWHTLAPRSEHAVV